MKFKFEIGDLIKLPNILCYLRIVMVPVFLYVYFSATEAEDYYMATAIVMLSGLTDFLDGQIARRCDMITDLGRIIDPVADKMMQFAMLIALTMNIKYMYLLVIYMFIKEAVSAVLGLFVMQRSHRRLNGAKWYGKVSTAVLYIVMLALIAFPHMVAVLQSLLIVICAAALTLSFVMYMRIYFVMIHDCKSGNEDKVLY